MALGARGSVARQREDYPETVRLLTRASDELTATGDVDQPAHRFHGDLLDALVAVGDLAGARGLIDRLDRRGRLGPRPGTLAIAERGRAQVALAENRLDEAAAHIARATALHDGSDAPLERARTQLVAAQLHRRAGRRKLADSQLRAALATLEAIGARGWAGRARDDLVRLGLRPGDEIELTPSEDRIARLAARGLRNREIASRLFISPKTVEASLGRAYAKLGVRSRTELANAIALTGAARESTDPLA